MATAEQIKALIKSHYDLDAERFSTIALQMAAYEAQKGHKSLAYELKSIVNKGKKSPLKVINRSDALSDLILWREPEDRLSSIILPDDLKVRIERILREFYQRNKLNKYGLSHRRKILLSGPPGTGKTMTASVIAGELDLNYYVILTDKIVTKYMGETAAKLRQIFDFISKNAGVYLFDEFDAIGAERGRDNEVGEMRRVLNSFLQFIENDKSNSFIIAATNNIDSLDQALFRRFDDVLFYELPNKNQGLRLMENKLSSFQKTFDLSKLPFKEFIGLSYSEIAQACDDAVKETVLSDKKKITRQILISMLQNRKKIYRTDKHK